MATLGDRLTAARRRAFVGREAELSLVQTWLADPDPAFSVLVVHGPAGVGKTTLLRHLAGLVADRGLVATLLDRRDLGGSRDDLPTLVTAAANGRPGVRQVLFLDGLDLCGELDLLLRERVLPALPADTLVVLAGRYPPGSDWSADPGWSGLVRSVALAGFDEDEARALLCSRGVPDEQLQPALAFTGGHPLALALVSEAIRTTSAFDPGRDRETIDALVRQVVGAAPGPSHRQALYAAATVLTVTEDLLAALLDVPDAGAEFDWLARLPLVSTATIGVQLDDLTRQVLLADLRWRRPDRPRELLARARSHLLAHVDVADDLQARHVVSELMYLHPTLRLLFTFEPPEGLHVQRADTADADAVVAMVQRHEGSDSARHARHWLQTRPADWSVVRDRDGTVRGCWLSLPLAGLADDGGDPAVIAAVRELARHPALRPGEDAILFRFWMAAEGYQAPCPELTLMTAQSARLYLTTPGLALTLTPFGDGATWHSVAEYSDLHRMPGADFSVGACSYTVFGHDWRLVPPAQWLARLTRRSSGESAPIAPGDPSAQQYSVLDRDAYAAAVRAGLRHVTRAERLRTNPLLQTRAVRARAGQGATVSARVTALQSMLTDAAATLRVDQRAYRVIHRAYLTPAESLEAAAEALGLPSSTFRRHLSAAVARVVDLLWAAELENADA